MKQSLQHLHQEFMNECRYASKLSPETLRGYQAGFDLLIKLMPNIEMTTICSKMIIEFFRRLENRERVVGKGQIKKGVKKTTIATYRSKLNKFFDWLARKGHLGTNPFREMEYPAVSYEDRKFLKKEDVEKIFTAVGFTIDWQSQLVRKRNFALMHALLYCGLRRGECMNLKMLDIDFQRKQLTVRAETSKSKRERVIPLNSKILLALHDYAEERKKYTTPYFFVSNNKDDKLTYDGLKHLVEKIIHASGVKFHVHQLRHTFAVNLLNNGCDVAKLKQLMGHTDIRMTMAYLRCIPTKAMRADIEVLSLDTLL